MKMIIVIISTIILFDLFDLFDSLDSLDSFNKNQTTIYFYKYIFNFLINIIKLFSCIF